MKQQVVSPGFTKKIEDTIGSVPSGQTVQGEIDALNSNLMRQLGVTIDSWIQNPDIKAFKLGNEYAIWVNTCIADLQSNVWLDIGTPSGFSPTKGNGTITICNPDGNPIAIGRIAISSSTGKLIAKSPVAQNNAYLFGGFMLCE